MIQVLEDWLSEWDLYAKENNIEDCPIAETFKTIVEKDAKDDKDDEDCTSR